MSKRRTEPAVYLDHVFALLIPGRRVAQHEAVPPEMRVAGDLTNWGEDELTLLIEESRLTLAAQETRFDRVRTTAQVVLPIAVALLVVVGGELRSISDVDSIWIRAALFVPWFFATSCVLGAGLGAAATLSVRSDFGMIFPPLVSRLKSPVRPQLAKEYVDQIATGEDTIATRITVIRDAVTLLGFGGVAYMILWLVRVL